jgi:hypothetical protein
MRRLRCPISLYRKTQVDMSELGHNREMKQAEEPDPVCRMKVDLPILLPSRFLRMPRITGSLAIEDLQQH